MGHTVCAITEHDTIASSIRAEKYYNKVKKDHPGFKLIRGNEIYLVRNGLNANNYNKDTDRYYHFIILAKDSIGAQQIREISTRAWNRSYIARRMRRVPTYYQDLIDIIGKNPGHVIGCTACLGGCLPTQLMRNKDTGAPSMDLIKRWIVQMQGIFGKEDFYFEMQPSFNKDQIYVNKKLVELGDEMGIKYIITNDAHYLKKEDRPIHKAFLNSQQGDREVDDFYATTYLMSDEEIYHYMEESLGEEVIQTAYRNINEIIDKCEDYTLMKPLKIPRLNWKRYIVDEKEINYWSEKIPYLEKFLSSEYKEDKHLAYAIIDRMEHGFNDGLWTGKTLKEINACLEDTWISSEVNGSRWSAYFLNLQNIIDSCWDAGTLVGCGRGSGVGFILLYLLGITQINPLREKSPTKRWRFLNPERVSVLDVDIDIEGGRRADILKNFRKVYGEDRVANVLTLKTEKSKSAILTAARGLGIDVDTAQYLSSFIQADRGQLRTLKQTFYGDADNGFSASAQFRTEMEENYPELWKVAQGIEGLINGCGIHAGGVIFVDEPFTNSTALMRAPSGEIMTQFDLHDAEDTGLIKYDVLSIEALDKIHNCLDLLCDYGYVEKEKTLKDTYEKVVGIYNIERDNPEMWKMCWEHKVSSLFQMEKQSGISGIAAMKPTSVDDLAILNSSIRLMATEKGGEMPVNKLARFKAHPDDWDYELKKYGLNSDKAKEILNPVLNISYGLCIAQEQFMQLVQLPELGGFNLTWADKLRKSIAKKNPAEYEKLTEEFFKVTKEKGCDENLCKYVWNVLIAMSRGYGFNLSHTLAYSLVGLQELNLAYKYPTIMWDCACLIADSGGAEKVEENEESEDRIIEESYDSSIGIFDEIEEEEAEEDEEDSKITKKKKANKVNYGKIATAIGKMSSEGIDIEATDINKSKYTFSPDVEHNRIIYGLSGINKVGDDIVKQIIENRPYNNISDFIGKVKINKPQMVNLIKSGAFDSLYGGDRIKAMSEYIDLISDKKKRITLQNMKMLMEFNLIPNDYEFQCKVYNFNKYLKKFKVDNYYGLNNIALNFYSNNFDMDLLTPADNEFVFLIKQTDWDKIYKKQMDIIRPFIQKNNEELLNSVNIRLRNDLWDKYCTGNISQWEMDSISCYIHDHELKNLKNGLYGLSDYTKLSEEPEVSYEFRAKDTGKKIPLFKIHRIAGTVLDKDKAKKTVTLLTTSGVVSVKIFGDAFTHYDKQISEKGADGVKHVKEKSWLSRGNKIIVTGIRREDNFIAKKYKNTPHHLVELITSIDEKGYIKTQTERIEI